MRANTRFAHTGEAGYRAGGNYNLKFHKTIKNPTIVSGKWIPCKRKHKREPGREMNMGLATRQPGSIFQRTNL